MDERTSASRRTVREEYFEPEGCWIAEWWNSPEDVAVSVAHVRVEPGCTTIRHRLRGIAERYLILSGHGRVEVGDDPPRDVGPGDVVAIPPGTAQCITSAAGANLVFLAVCTPRFRLEAYEALRTAA